MNDVPIVDLHDPVLIAAHRRFEAAWGEWVRTRRAEEAARAALREAETHLFTIGYGAGSEL